MPAANHTDTGPKTTYLKDYHPPAWWVDTVNLQFILDDHATEVTSILTIRKNTDTGPQPLKLDAESLQLKTVLLDGKQLDTSQYALTDTSLTIEKLPDECTITTVVEINPADNTSLMGLYQSSGNFCTQCEAEGFRKITFFPDRPDILSVYTVTILAEKNRYPVLLSNGNPGRRGDAEPDTSGNVRHFAIWHDPHPKPCYLFALVAGNLACINDEFTTMSGRHVDINIYVEPHNDDKCSHAMRSIINAMKWDEQAYGREYDLDVFNIVAVDDFNMGAMENKGLNIFNSKYVLARLDTATDSDYQNIENVIGHEYFHNWSGNRVTCRDWFQLSLKEGFTVFRDQEFSSDMGGRGIKRIQDVSMLRTHQFREDAGPMAHPVRPEQYIEINNFYTLTVYEKGAEIIRMARNLLGSEMFRKGTDLYFSRHDGQAVTTDDFFTALEDVSDYNLQQFRRWYSTAGTPELNVSEHHDISNNEYTLTIQQQIPDTPGQTDKPALHIPLQLGLLDVNGKSLAVTLKGENVAGETTRVLQLKNREQTFIFTGLSEKPTASLLRSFSAPVKLNMPRSVEELCFLMTNDNDEFNRWDAGQILMTQLMVKQFDNEKITVNPTFIKACYKTLTDPTLKPALVAEILRLPAENLLADQCTEARPERIHMVHNTFRTMIAKKLHDALLVRYHELTQSSDYTTKPDDMGKRSLRNLCLYYLISKKSPDPDSDIINLCINQFNRSNNMTDVIAALACLNNVDNPAREIALNSFYEKWKHDTLVMDKWFALQAMCELPDTLQHVKTLTQHPAFNIKNPNKVRSLIGAFAGGNPQHFHAIDGTGYKFITDHIIELDKLNPQIAARIASTFSRWRQYNKPRQELMQKQLQRILDTGKPSKDVFEIVSKSLNE